MTKKKTPEQKSERPKKTPYAKYTSFRMQPRIKSSEPALAGSFTVLKRSFGLMARSWKSLLGVVLLYGVLNVIFVQSFSTLDIAEVKDGLAELFAGDWSELIGGVSIFAYLIGTATVSVSQAAGVYQFLLLLISSLATIWILRQTFTDKKFRFRDAYYKGMHPLIPFLLVLTAVTLQTIPVLLGTYLYSFAGRGGQLMPIELAVWSFSLLSLATLTLYMLSSSLFALYIACLPDVTPMQALRSARSLVRFRRWTVMRRLLFLPFFILLSGAAIMMPIIIFVTPAAVWVFFVLTMVTIPVAHAYMYSLYRELIK